MSQPCHKIKQSNQMRHGFYNANLMQSVTFDRKELKFLNKKKKKKTRYINKF